MLSFIYQDQDVVIWNKPSGWHSTGVRGQTVELKARELFPELAHLKEAGLVHRLDELTSGCLMSARNERAFERFRGYFQKSGMKKTYLAWVEGRPPSSGEFSFYFSSRYRGSKKVTVETRGRHEEHGVCRWKRITSDSELLSIAPSYSLLEVDLIGPGKRHQIRAGFSKLGFPVGGDILYGARTWVEPDSKRHFGLHAWKLKWGGIEILAPVYTNDFATPDAQ